MPEPTPPPDPSPFASEVRRLEWASAPPPDSRFTRRFRLQFHEHEHPEAVELTLGDFDLLQLNGVSAFKVIPTKSIERSVLFYGSGTVATMIQSEGQKIWVPTNSPAQIAAESLVTSHTEGSFLLVALPNGSSCPTASPSMDSTGQRGCSWNRATSSRRSPTSWVPSSRWGPRGGLWSPTSLNA